jgi:ubiquitin C-terminal hydrolase
MKKSQKKENNYNSNKVNENDPYKINIWDKNKIKTYTGMIRFENYKRRNLCFINSSIQCFLQLKQFKDNILKIKNEDLNKLELTKEFKNLLIKIENNEIKSNVLNIKKILSKVEEKYKTNEQCDANEFISIFLNQMLNELKGIGPLSNNIFPNNINDPEMKKQFERLNKLFINKNNSFLIDLFYGKLIKELYCEEGHRINIKFQIYNIIELPIMENNKVKLIDLLNEYQDNHIVDEKIECNECGKKVECYSKTTIFNIPKYLILFLNQNLLYK